MPFSFNGAANSKTGVVFGAKNPLGPSTRTKGALKAFFILF